MVSLSYMLFVSNMDESGEGQANLINFLPSHKNSHIIFHVWKNENKWEEQTPYYSYTLIRTRESGLQWWRGCIRGAGGGRDRGGWGGVLHDAGA